MKIILENKQAQNFILKYFDENYGDLNWKYYLDDEGNDTDCGIVYYSGDFDYDDIKFRLYRKCYWNIKDGESAALEMYEKSPILIFEKSSEFEKLSGFFGDFWIPIFKDWFQKNYGYSVKTVEW